MRKPEMILAAILISLWRPKESARNLELVRLILVDPPVTHERLPVWTGYFLRPRSINSRMASDRLTECSSAHRSTRTISVSDNRIPTMGRTPVAGRPLFFCLTDIDRFIFFV
jgi:hypothetical protein